jgi:hypothetical protein
MAWLAFTKKAQTKNIALLELKHLFKMLESFGGVPPAFWCTPYAVGFVSGYTMGAGVFVAKKRVNPADVNKAFVDILFELAGGEARDAAKRLAAWHAANDPQFDEGHTNGTILALFLLGTNAVDNEPSVLEARRRANTTAAALSNLPSRPNERGRTAIVLRQMLFYDRVRGVRVQL